MSDSMKIERRSGVIRRVRPEDEPVLSLELGPGERLLSAKMERNREYDYKKGRRRNPKRVTFDWVWEAYVLQSGAVETWLRELIEAAEHFCESPGLVDFHGTERERLRAALSRVVQLPPSDEDVVQLSSNSEENSDA